MRLVDLFADEWSRIPLEAASLGEGLQEMLGALEADGILSSREVEERSGKLASGGEGERVRLDDDIIAVLAAVPALDRPRLALGVSRAPFRVEAGGEFLSEARGLFLVLTAGPISRARRELVPPIRRVLTESGQSQALLGVRSVAQVRDLRELMETEFSVPDRVADAMVPVRYRVYPDTPLDEVLDLIVRRGVRAVPVVGDQYEVLGILTLGDALGHFLKKGSPGARTRAVADRSQARDVMTRTVLCVSEDQPLMDAAAMMVNRDVEQLPVVREGELVGFLTRASILRTLHESDIREPTDERKEE